MSTMVSTTVSFVVSTTVFAVVILALVTVVSGIPGIRVGEGLGEGEDSQGYQGQEENKLDHVDVSVDSAARGGMFFPFLVNGLKYQNAYFMHKIAN